MGKCLLMQIHFRQQHFLCEDEACLAKKFVVFQSESEMKVTDYLQHTDLFPFLHFFVNGLFGMCLCAVCASA